MEGISTDSYIFNNNSANIPHNNHNDQLRGSYNQVHMYSCYGSLNEIRQSLDDMKQQDGHIRNSPSLSQSGELSLASSSDSIFDTTGQSPSAPLDHSSSSLQHLCESFVKLELNNNPNHPFFTSTTGVFYNYSDVFDHKGNSPLSWASFNGRCDVVQALVEEYGLPINWQNSEGETPLSLAVRGEHQETVLYLLERGANPNISNFKGETPLHMAAALGLLEISKCLIKYGAWIEIEDDCGETPLHWAVREDQCHLVELFLNAGADPNHQNEDEETPELLARIVSSPSVLNLFQKIDR